MVPVQGIQSHHHLLYDLGIGKKALNSCSGEGYGHTNTLMTAPDYHHGCADGREYA